MRVFIYATEGFYQGLHGIYNQCVTEVDNFEEAESIGRDLAVSLVEDYGLEEDYYDEEDEYIIDPEFNWIICRIDDEFNHISTADLDSIAYDMGYEDFIEKYCVEELN